MFTDTVPESSTERKNAPSAPQRPNSRNPRTCITCKRRKVKCDRKTPCANCIKAQIQCIYPPPGRAPRQAKRGMKVLEKGILPELVDQVWSMMTRVMEQSMNPEMAALKQSVGEPSSQPREPGLKNEQSSRPTSVRVVGMDEAMESTLSGPVSRGITLGSESSQSQLLTHLAERRPGQLVLGEGKSQYIPSPFWASMSETIKEGIQEILEEREDESDDDTTFMPTDIPFESNHHSFIMGYTSTNADLKKLHPPRSQIPFYWQTFQLNVNPVTKLVHIPTMDNVITEIQNNLDSLSASTEALMFSIYYATVVSMSPDDVNTNMNAEKEYLLRRYRFAVEQALARARFLDTSEIVTLQAFALFLVCVRTNDDSRFVWTLTGLAIRLAQAIGLHRDGTKFGLSPFNTEMRRRLWWQLCILDVRASEDHGFELTIRDQSFDTKFPLSINDTDIRPETTETPVPETGVSEMTPCLIRIEICHLTQRLFYAAPGSSVLPMKSDPLSFEERERMLRETSSRMEKQYLQYGASAGSAYWSIATIARLILAKTSLLIYQPLTHPAKPNNLPQSTKDRLLIASIELAEYTKTLRSDPASKRFMWLFQTYTLWHCIAYILTELAVRPPSPIVDRAWGAVLIFRDTGVINGSSRTGMLWQPLRVLLRRAMRKREENKRLYASQYLQLNMEGQYVCPPLPETQTNPIFAVGSSAANPSFPIPPALYVPGPGMYIQPQYGDMEPPLALDHRTMLMQEQLIVQMQYQPPFLVDDTAMQDLEMSNLQMADMGEENWDSWDQLVPGYHTSPSHYQSGV